MYRSELIQSNKYLHKKRKGKDLQQMPQDCIKFATVTFTEATTVPHHYYYFILQ